MANDILIRPTASKIEFSGSAHSSIRLEVQDSGSVVFQGSSGSLFGITDSMSGSLFSVNDVSGLPIMEVFSDDKITLGRYQSPIIIDQSGSISGSLTSTASFGKYEGITSFAGAAGTETTFSGSSTSTASFGKINIVDSIGKLSRITSSFALDVGPGEATITGRSWSTLKLEWKNQSNGVVYSDHTMKSTGHKLGLYYGGSYNILDLQESNISRHAWSTTNYIASHDAFQYSSSRTSVHKLGAISASGDITMDGSGSLSGSITSTGSFGLLLQNGSAVGGDSVTDGSVNSFSGSITSTGSFGDLRVVNRGTVGAGLKITAPSTAWFVEARKASNGYSVIRWNADNDDALWNFGLETTNNLYFYSYGSSTVPLELHRDTGRVGMGLAFNQNPQAMLHVGGDIRANGNVIANQLIVSSSITHMTTSFSSGSTKFGDTIDDTHEFTGSVDITGSLTLNGGLEDLDRLGINGLANHTGVGIAVHDKTIVLKQSSGNDSGTALVFSEAALSDNSFVIAHDGSGSGRNNILKFKTYGNVNAMELYRDKALVIHGNVTASADISGSLTSTGSFGRILAGPGGDNGLSGSTITEVGMQVDVLTLNSHTSGGGGGGILRFITTENSNTLGRIALVDESGYAAGFSFQTNRTGGASDTTIEMMRLSKTGHLFLQGGVSVSGSSGGFSGSIDSTGSFGRVDIGGSGSVAGWDTKLWLKGTTSEATALHIESTNAAAVSALRFETNGNNWYWAAGGSSQGYFPNKFYLYNEGGSVANPLTVQNDGKIGLGTRNPAFNLENDGDSYQTGKAIFGNNLITWPTWGRLGIALGGSEKTRAAASSSIHARFNLAHTASSATLKEVTNTDINYYAIVSGLLLENTSDSGSSGGQVHIRSAGARSASVHLYGENAGVAGNSRMSLWTEYEGTSYERMTLEPSGAVKFGDSVTVISGSMTSTGSFGAVSIGSGISGGSTGGMVDAELYVRGEGLSGAISDTTGTTKGVVHIDGGLNTNVKHMITFGNRVADVTSGPLAAMGIHSSHAVGSGIFFGISTSYINGVNRIPFVINAQSADGLFQLAGNKISGSITSTGSFGKLIGDGSSLTNLPASSAFPYNSTTRADVTGSMHISSSVGTATASLVVEGSGSEVFTVKGTNGTLFSVSDELSGSLFAVTNVAGLPVVEAFSNNKVNLGPFSKPVGVTDSGSLTVSGSMTGVVVSMSIASNTASMDARLSNFFHLQLASGADTYLTASNISPGQSINLQVTQQATSGTISYSDQFKFPNGMPYAVSATGSGDYVVTDLVSFVSFDSQSLFGTALKNLT